MPCDFCVLRARSLVFLSLFGIISQQYTSNTKFSYFIFLLGPTGIKELKKGDSQTKDQKTPKTRREHPGFRNGLGTVPGVYEATTIAHQPLRSHRWAALVGCSKLHFGQISRLPSLQKGVAKCTCLLREGPCSRGASWAICGFGVPRYEFSNLYDVFNSRFSVSFS
jgi:hypothetical protein